MLLWWINCNLLNLPRYHECKPLCNGSACHTLTSHRLNRQTYVWCHSQEENSGSTTPFCHRLIVVFSSSSSSSSFIFISLHRWSMLQIYLNLNPICIRSADDACVRVCVWQGGDRDVGLSVGCIFNVGESRSSGLRLRLRVSRCIIDRTADIETLKACYKNTHT